MSDPALAAVAAGLAGLLSIAMIVAWRTALATERSGYIDAIWSLATGAACVIAALVPSGQPVRQALVAAMAAVWSLRLGLYLWRRAAEADDPRYAALKRQWGPAAPRRLFLFLQGQALASAPLVLTAYVAAHTPRAAPDWRDLLGLCVFVVALAGEGLADRQMAYFRADPANRGRICDVGLWSWSRHPNYFCEWLLWVAYPLIAFGSGYPAGLAALAAPALMYWLLVHVSGVPPLEAHLRRSRPDAFARYSARVSLFWPRPPARD